MEIIHIILASIVIATVIVVSFTVSIFLTFRRIRRHDEVRRWKRFYYPDEDLRNYLGK